MDFSNQHELHAIAIAGGTYAVTRSIRTSAIVGIGLLTYMSVFGHGLPSFSGKDDPPAPQSLYEIEKEHRLFQRNFSRDHATAGLRYQKSLQRDIQRSLHSFF